jgi:hypothetical protein
MKKITIILVSLMALLPMVSKADPGDATYVEFNKEYDPEEHPRSSTQDIGGCYWPSSGILELSFNLYMGSVTVEVSDQSSIVVGFTNLSTTPGSLFMPLVLGSGTYTVLIETSTGDQYTGRFVI